MSKPAALTDGSDGGLPPPSLQTGMLDRVRAIVRTDLAPIVGSVDADGLYPEHVLKKLGEVGCYAAHSGLRAGGPDLCTAIEATALVAEECLSTAFCVWCQNACVWYLHHTDNAHLRARLIGEISAGTLLAGTGLSNPMKALSGIEQVRLRGTRIKGGYRVSGKLPFVSNLGDNHPFGTVFESDSGERIMALASCALDGVTGSSGASFCALEGTRTWSLRFTDAFIPDDLILAAPLESFARKIKPGFILLQTGLAIGLVRSCIRLMDQFSDLQAGVNALLDEDPRAIENDLADLEASAYALASLPPGKVEERILDILDTRLMLAELALRAARGAMLYSGARGYMKTAAPQRKLREAFFVAILTPSIRHLRHDVRSATEDRDRVAAARGAR